MTILCFGVIAEKTGCKELRIPVLKNTEALKEWILSQYPEMKNISFTIAVNCVQVTQNEQLAAGCEIALLPPYSGG
jgi:molybdopterin converting factor small subunit